MEDKLTMISDRGTYSAGHPLRLKDAGCDAVCTVLKNNVPWGELRGLFDEHRSSLKWSEASYLSIEQQRRRTQNSSLPREHYQIAGINEMSSFNRPVKRRRFAQ